MRSAGSDLVRVLHARVNGQLCPGSRIMAEANHALTALCVVSSRLIWPESSRAAKTARLPTASFECAKRSSAAHTAASFAPSGDSRAIAVSRSATNGCKLSSTCRAAPGRAVGRVCYLTQPEQMDTPRTLCRV